MIYSRASTISRYIEVIVAVRIAADTARSQISNQDVMMTD